MKKEDFFNMCEEVFPILFEFYNKPNDEISKIFLDWTKENCSPEKYEIQKKKIEQNNNRYPRITSYMMEYISCFYFMYLKSLYKNALESPLVSSIKLKRNFFSFKK